MPRVFIPPAWRIATGGVEQIDVEGATLRQVLAAVEARFPGLTTRALEGPALRPGIAIAIDGHVATRGLSQPVAPASEIHFLPAIGGG